MLMLKVALFVAAFVAFLFWAGGNRTMSIMLRAFRFIVLQPWVLFGWLVGSLGMLWLMIDGAQSNGRDVMAVLPLAVAVSAFSGLGFSALIVGGGFMLRRSLTPFEAFQPPAGEHIEWKGKANHFLRGESRGGVAYVTERAVHFGPGRYSVQREPWTLERAMLAKGECIGARLCVLTDSDGAEHVLVLEKPSDLFARLWRRGASRSAQNAPLSETLPPEPSAVGASPS